LIFVAVSADVGTVLKATMAMVLAMTVWYGSCDGRWN
jgi:hypothetical protein